jgi:hypothetical protein
MTSKSLPILHNWEETHSFEGQKPQNANLTRSKALDKSHFKQNACFLFRELLKECTISLMRITFS